MISISIGLRKVVKGVDCSIGVVTVVFARDTNSIGSIAVTFARDTKDVLSRTDADSHQDVWTKPTIRRNAAKRTLPAVTMEFPVEARVPLR
jgi:hypothetical protein